MIDIYKVPVINQIRIEELVPEIVFKQFGQSAWRFIQPQLYHALISSRAYFNKQHIINDWLWGGDFEFRGFRPHWYTGGARYSAHRTGNAVDYDVVGVTAREVREVIQRHPEWGFTRVEAKVSWVHGDTVWMPGEQGVVLIQPGS